MIAALREAHRVLRAGGILSVVEPLAQGPGHELVADADALAERVVGVAPTRAERMQEHRTEFAERFEALAVRVGDDDAFDQENRVKVFRKGT